MCSKSILIGVVAASLAVSVGCAKKAPTSSSDNAVKGCANVYQTCQSGITDGGKTLTEAECATEMKKTGNESAAACLASLTDCSKVNSCLQTPTTDNPTKACGFVYQTCKSQMAVGGQPVSESACISELQKSGNESIAKCIADTTDCAKWDACLQTPTTDDATKACTNLYDVCNDKLTLGGQALTKDECIAELGKTENAALAKCMADGATCDAVTACLN
jgi:hypothetical protein